MEARNITVVSTANQNKYVVNTDATTLSELKAALRAQNISYDGMTFYEGLSHTELLTDDAILPHDVPYKGQVTNELVFMLTVPNKKIKSGANLSETRQGLYDAINELGLKDACVSTYGRNFTQCKNSELMALIEEAQENPVTENASSIEKAFRLLISILTDDEIICTDDAEAVLNLIGGSEEPAVASPYDDKEISEIFSFLD